MSRKHAKSHASLNSKVAGVRNPKSERRVGTDAPVMNTGVNRDQVLADAIVDVLLHTNLRVSELVALDLSQYQKRHLINVRRKRKTITRKLLLRKPARDSLDEYLEVRGKAAGLLFQSRGGRRLTPRNVELAVKKTGVSWSIFIS
jgi:site-specific recombinase XerC